MSATRIAAIFRVAAMARPHAPRTIARNPAGARLRASLATGPRRLVDTALAAGRQRTAKEGTSAVRASPNCNEAARRPVAVVASVGERDTIRRSRGRAAGPPAHVLVVPLAQPA